MTAGRRQAPVRKGRGPGGGAPGPGLTQEKHLSRQGGGGGAAGAAAQGRLPSGRQATAPPSARRRSEETLRALGKETALDTAARLEATGQHAAARAMRAWVNTDQREVLDLVRALPGTRGGSPRELRLGMCGVAFVARRGEAVGFARRGCKDRLCPHCSARRSRRFAAALRAWVARRDDAALRFVTLTQPKQPMEEPRAALDRLLKSFRGFVKNAWGKRHIRGGVRCVEVTARAAGDRVGDYVVRVPGVHAHLHCILEVAPGVTAPDIAAAWGVGSDASVAGVDVQRVTEDNVYQCAKYPLDMSGLPALLTCARPYVMRVLEALRGRRLVEAFGAWRGAPLGLREDDGTLTYGDRSVYGLATAGAAAQDKPFRWHDGRVEPAGDVLAQLLDAGPEPLG